MIACVGGVDVVVIVKPLDPVLTFSRRSAGFSHKRPPSHERGGRGTRRVRFPYTLGVGVAHRLNLTPVSFVALSMFSLDDVLHVLPLPRNGKLQQTGDTEESITCHVFRPSTLLRPIIHVLTVHYN